MEKKGYVVSVKCDGIDTTVDMTASEIAAYFKGLAEWYENESNITPRHFEFCMDKSK